MSLNRVSNPGKLRKLAALVGEPVVRAYARWFEGHTLLVFGQSGRQYAVDPKGSVEAYTHDPPLTLTESGIRQ